MPSTVLICTITAKGEKVRVVDFEKGGVTAQAKAWVDDVATWEAGKQAEVEFYERKAYNSENMEKWMRPVKAAGGGFKGGGGAAKSDPVKNAIIKEANEKNNASMAYASNLKAATSCWEMAVQLLGTGAGINEVRAVAMDISTGIRETAALMGGKS